MLFKKKLTVGLLSLIIIVTTFGTAKAKSVYSIIDHGRRPFPINNAPAKIAAYVIDGDQISQQFVYELDQADYPTGAYLGPVGLAVDSESGYLFVTHENEGYGGLEGIQLVNAKSMTDEGVIEITGAPDLAGIVFDEDKDKIYTVERETNKLFVLLWGPRTRTLTLEGGEPKTLAEIGNYACGLALDEIDDILYVTSIQDHSAVSNVVHYYDVNDPNWTHLGSIEIVVDGNDRNALGVAVYNDGQGTKYLYTGAYSFSPPGHPYLVRTDLNDPNDPNSFIEKDIGASATDIAVDQDTGFVYVTASDNEIKVFDGLNFPSDPCDTNSDPNISGPAGICVPTGDVSYKPPLLVLTKDDNDVSCVVPGDYIDYTITYDANGHDVNDVNIIDYLPDEVDFNSASGPNMTYNSDSNTVTWVIGTLLPTESNSVTLNVQVNELAEPNGIITNYCEMESSSTYNTAEVNTPVCYWCGDIIYVDVNAPTDYNTGASWQNAYKDLQDALDTARNCECNEIWVAEGTYTPSATVPWYATFELIDGVAIYGGFDGTETSLSQRDWITNETTLSGDIDTDGDSDVEYVVTASGVSETAVIDGFIIRKGYTGGIYSNGGSPTISHNRITENLYGVHCYTNCTPNITNCWIQNNSGDGILLQSNNLETIIRNNTIVDNTLYGIKKSFGVNPNITNCIIWANGDDLESCYATYSCIQNDDPGEGNITGDANNPRFVDANNNDYHIASDSPCIDAGDPNFTDPNETDIDGEPRVMGDCNEIVDMGADEVYFPGCWNCLTQCHGDADCSGFVDTADWPPFRDGFLKCYPDPVYIENVCGDFNRDGCINTEDFGPIRDNWLTYPDPDCDCGGTWPPE